MRQYVGNGEYIPRVPARTLTEAEYKAIPKKYKAIAERIYRKVERGKSEPRTGG